ncbi:MAG TPA: hypothetical protein VIS73_00640 [Rhodocyclaceae bacterium]
MVLRLPDRYSGIGRGTRSGSPQHGATNSPRWLATAARALVDAAGDAGVVVEVNDPGVVCDIDRPRDLFAATPHL